MRLRLALSLLGLLGLLGGVAGPAAAQISYSTSGSVYTQNFDNLLTTVPANNSTTANTVLPSGFTVVEAGSNANTTIRVDNGSSGTGDSFLYGATNSNERALGSFSSGSLTSIFGAQFVNNTGTTLTQFTLTYTGEQWKDGRSASAVQNVLAFSYGLGNTSITTGTFTSVAAGNFAAPINVAGTSDVTLDGNAAANQTAITFTVMGLNWTAGQNLFIRFSDINEAGNDDGLAVDDLSFSAVAGAQPNNLVFNNAAATGLFNTTDANFLNTATSATTTFTTGDNVTFNDTAVGTVNVSPAAVGPGTLTVSNTAGTQAFTGAAINVSTTLTVSGAGNATFTNAGVAAGSLAKSGAGTLVLNTSGGNTFTTVSLTGGVTELQAAGQFGAAPISIDGGTLRVSTVAQTTSGVLTLANSATIETFTDLSLGGNIVGSGTFTKSGAGSLIFGARDAGGFTGSVSLAAGTLRGTVGGNTFGNATVVTVAAGATYDESFGDGEGLGGFAGAGTVVGRSGQSLTAGGPLPVVFDGLLTAGTNGVVGAADADRVLSVGVTGGASLTLTNALNDFAGGVAVTSGTVSISGVANKGTASAAGTGNFNPTPGPDFSFGGGTTTLTAGALVYTGGTASTDRALDLRGNGGTVAVSSAGTTLTVSGVVSGTATTAGLTKDGPGTLTLTGANTYAGGTTVAAGTLALGATGALPTASPVVLAGGTLATAAGTANGDKTGGGPLTLAANSVIDFGNAGTLTTLSFGTSSGVAWAGGTTLTINGYKGTTAGGGLTQLFVGPDANGLTAAQLSQINFIGSEFGLGASLLFTGEVVPNAVPEPATVLGLAAAGLGVGGFVRRRLRGVPA